MACPVVRRASHGSKEWRLVYPLLLSARVTVRSGRHEPKSGWALSWMGIVAGSSPLRRLFRGTEQRPTARRPSSWRSVSLCSPHRRRPSRPQRSRAPTPCDGILVLMRIRVSIRTERRTVCPSRSSGGSAFRKGSLATRVQLRRARFGNVDTSGSLRIQSRDGCELPLSVAAAALSRTGSASIGPDMSSSS